MNHFEKLLEEARLIHDKKSHDYASDEDRFSNFTRAAEIVSWFKNPIDQVFACMIGIKIARLAELRNGKNPNNESIRDSHLDLFVYSGLWTSYYDSLNEVNELDVVQEPLDGYVGAPIAGKRYKVHEALIKPTYRVEGGRYFCNSCSYYTTDDALILDHIDTGTHKS